MPQQDHTEHLILVADDDPDMRAYIKGCLQQLGMDVVEAANGQAALERARQVDIDLIVADVVMPRMTGLALCWALQAEPALSDIPVLLITGEEPPPTNIAGAKGMLLKPFNAISLAEEVHRLLGDPGRSPPDS